MLPRLNAEDALIARDTVALGTGAYDEAAAKRIVSGWVTMAKGGVDAPKKRAAKPTPEQLAAMGIAFSHG